jgi:hypothetical protein
MCNCTSGNLEIPGSLVSLVPRNDENTRTIQQQDTKNQHQGDDRHHQTRGPVHAAADPPEQRATHEHGNDDIELQWPALVAAQRPPLEPPTPMLTAPPIFTQVSVPSTLTKPGP